MVDLCDLPQEILQQILKVALRLQMHNAPAFQLLAENPYYGRYAMGDFIHYFTVRACPCDPYSFADLRPMGRIKKWNWSMLIAM